MVQSKISKEQHNNILKQSHIILETSQKWDMFENYD